MAVLSYLDWVSFSYRMVNSELSTMTMSPREAVRVDAYIERNRQENRGIEQRVTSFEERSFSQEESQSVIAATEEWEYRYFTISPLAYSSPQYEITYDSTYTVVPTESGWAVDSVEVTPRGEVR